MKKEKTKSNKKQTLAEILTVAAGLLVGGLCGVVMARACIQSGSEQDSMGNFLEMLGMLVGLYLGVFFQIIVHESGHLVFGLLSGYRFCSFRILSFILVKEEGKLHIRHLSLAGTGGQCLMVPPEGDAQDIPVILYNLGGSLMNLLVSGLLLGLYFWIGPGTIPATLALMVALVGVLFAAMNGIPIKMGLVENDGSNALAMHRSPIARRGLWLQLKVNEQISKGVRLKDMPQDWFQIPSDEEMQESLMAAVGAMVCNRMMDAHQFQEADAQMARMLAMESAMSGLQKKLLLCDRIYLELIGENRTGVLEMMQTGEQLAFMKSMKTYPSVLRTQYVQALLGQKDGARAQTALAEFEKQAARYPYPSEMELERELIQIAQQKGTDV